MVRCKKPKKWYIDTYQELDKTVRERCANLTNFKAIFYCKSTARHNIMRVADEHVTLGQIIMNSLFPLL